MEPDPASRLTGRQQRAVGLIAISLLAIVVACVAYVIPSLHLGEAAKPKTITAHPPPSPPPNYPTMYVSTVVVTNDGGMTWAKIPGPPIS